MQSYLAKLKSGSLSVDDCTSLHYALYQCISKAAETFQVFIVCSCFLTGMCFAVLVFIFLDAVRPSLLSLSLFCVLCL